jgi:hypothetical protein
MTVHIKELMEARKRAREKREHKRLLRLWATGRATRKQIERCMELDRRVRQ